MGEHLKGNGGSNPPGSTYRVGIIGCGWVGCGVSQCATQQKPDTHARAYMDNPRTLLVGMCDKTFASGSNYYDYMDMVKKLCLDIVSVCTPPQTHAQIVCDIAPYVKAIYCEKPIALTLKDADRMVSVCHKYGVILQVNHQRRFIPPKFRFSRDIVDTGTHVFDRLIQLFGDPLDITARDIKFRNITVDIEFVKSQEHIFELDCVRSRERMIPLGVQHLVECLDRGMESISSGEEARKTLELVLKFKELHEST